MIFASSGNAIALAAASDKPCRVKSVVLAAKPKFEQLAMNALDDRTRFDGSPAVDGNRLLLRSGKFLYCLGQ